MSIIDYPEYKNYEKPDDNSIIIHLRVGDVIDKSDLSVDDYLHKSTKNTETTLTTNNKHIYVYNLEYYSNILKKIPSNIKNIVLVYGYHIKLDNSKSEEYIEKLKQFFESKGYNVKKRTNGDADKDFIYMCNAKHFIPSGGGFSKLIANIVKLKNNNVY